jgi:hypothetical protein
LQCLGKCQDKSFIRIDGNNFEVDSNEGLVKRWDFAEISEDKTKVNTVNFNDPVDNTNYAKLLMFVAKVGLYHKVKKNGKLSDGFDPEDSFRDKYEELQHKIGNKTIEEHINYLS